MWWGPKAHWGLHQPGTFMDSKSSSPMGWDMGSAAGLCYSYPPLHLDALDSFKVNLLMSLLQWSVSLHILKYLVPMVLKICCDWELFQCKVLVKIQHVSRAALNKDCSILHIILKLWQFSCTYNVTFHWSLIIDLKVKSLPCFIKNNNYLYQVQSQIFRDVTVCVFSSALFSINDSKNRCHLPQSEQCRFCLQPKLCHSLVNVPAGLFMSPFHVLLLSLLVWASLFILAVVIWPWSVFAPQLEVDVAQCCSFWIFLFC